MSQQEDKSLAVLQDIQSAYEQRMAKGLSITVSHGLSAAECRALNHDAAMRLLALRLQAELDMVLEILRVGHLLSVPRRLEMAAQGVQPDVNIEEKEEK